MISLLAAAALYGQMPAGSGLPPITRDPQITYVDRTGAVIGVRGGRFSPVVDLARLPAYVPAAFVAIEDRRFYEHGGFDAVGIARAIITDLAKGRPAQGASTITQQLARNLYLNDDVSASRKAQELLYSVRLEQVFTKQQILALYLSRIYFGEGAYGIEQAAQRYFNKPAERLTLHEAAVLAALPKSPTGYDPVLHPEASAERTRLVLDAMRETGAINASQRAQGLAQPLYVWKSAPTAPAQYFVDWLDGQTRALVGQPRQDLTVDTTLDMSLETTAAKTAAATVAKYRTKRVEQTALVSMDGDGRLRALLGGVDYAASPFDRAVQAHRQAGSSWKPFVYLTALEAGRTPDTVVIDEPVTINGWSPRNFEPDYLGAITLQQALAQSINTVAARLADEVGRPNVAATAHRLGIVSPINTDPAMALGTTLVTPLEMAQAYDALANGGRRVSAYGIERIRVNGGRVLYQHQMAAEPQVVANPPLSELDQMMRAVLVSGTGTHAAVPGYDLAGKTGTTSDFKDAWFCGFTGNLTTVVWMGRDDSTPMRGITGGSAPADFWRGYMRVALRHEAQAPIPAGPPAPPPAEVVPAPVEVAPPPAVAPLQPPPPAEVQPPLPAPNRTTPTPDVDSPPPADTPPPQ